MSALKQEMQVIDSHHISNRLLNSNFDKLGGLITNGQYAWFISGANIILYSKQLGSVVSSRSFAGNQKDKSLKITYVKELKNNEETCDLILVGCSFKSSGILFVCQLPTLTTIRCISIPNPITYIATIMNESLDKDQLCDEFKIMSTILLVGMNTGAVYAIDLRKYFIEKQLKRNEVVVNELRPNKLFIMKKGEDCAGVKEISDNSDGHVAIFLNENFYSYCKKLYSAKLNLKVSSLLYVEEINTIAIGYSTGHFQLWDCKVMRTIYLLREPKCVMPVTHINFLEPSDDPNNLCYLWIMQSDNTKLPNATMIALTYEQRIVMPNGCLSYRIFQGSGIKLEMSLRRETGIGQCISALSLCNVNLFRNETDMDEDCEIRLFSMLMEVRQNADSDPDSYIFLFDINQWYKAQMPSNITHLQVSNSYASFVKLPHNVSYLDFNISGNTLRPFGCNFRNNVEELYYPSSIYFECDCLVGTEIVRFKHAGVQQAILDRLLLKSWRLLINPSLIFNECIQTNLRPFFWDKTDEYVKYSLPDQRSFVISILVENRIMSVLSACAEEWKNGTYASSEATILHLVQCLWKHVMVVKQYADKLCVPLFDYSGTRLDRKNKRILNHCLSQMQCVKHFLEDLHNAYGVHIINVDYSYRVYTLNLVTQYFKAVLCFLSYGLLPESIEQDPMQSLIQCDFTHLIQYANKRRMEFGDSQLYLIDAIVNNEPKGNKLIEQWLHEGGEETKGMYPPSNVQCLLRIYLNAALSDKVKDFITIYFLIDVCSMKELDRIVANRMCNFALEFEVSNKGLNTLCRASWLLDHDMFQEAMDILAENKEWKTVNDKSWDWFHWVVLKLLVFKSEYFWARYYMKLVDIKIINIDDHKFYINLQIMNDQCFDAIHYMRSRPQEEKQVLFEYFFDRCKEINKLKFLIEYLCEKEEEDLFFSYLEKFKDAESLTFQLLFLLQRGKYLEAIELNKSIDVVKKLKFNDTLKLTSDLVNGFEKSLPKTLRKKSWSRPPFQNLFKKRDIVVKCMSSDSKMFSITDRRKENIFEKRNSMSSNLINLIIPANKTIRKRSPTNDVVHNEKRRKLNDSDVPDQPKIVENEILRPIGKQVLDILNTPLVEKTIVSPSITSCSSILKTGSAKKHKRVLTIKDDETSVSRTVLRFSLPGDEDSKVNRFGSETSIDIPKANQENESSYDIDNSSSKELLNLNTKQQILNNLKDSQSDYSKMELSNDIVITDEKSSIEDEKMDVSEYYEPEEVEDMFEKESEEILILSDDDAEKEMTISKSKLENTSFISNQDSETSIEILSYSNVEENIEVSQQSVHIDEEESSSPQFITMNPLTVDNSEDNTQGKLSSSEKSRVYNKNIFFPNSNESKYVKEQICDDDDDDVILLNSDDENPLSDKSSSINYVDECSVSDDSDLEITRYGRFKSKNKGSSEDIDERSNVSNEEEDEQIDVEQYGISSEDNLSGEGEMCSGDEIISSEDDEEKIDLDQSYTSSDEDKANSLELHNDKHDENSEDENNLKPDYIEIDDESREENNLNQDCVEIDDESGEENNLNHDNENSNDRNLDQYGAKFDDKNLKNYKEQRNVMYFVESDENDYEQNDVHIDKGLEHNSENENDKSCDLSLKEDCGFKSNNKLEILTSCSSNLTEENCQPNYNYKNENVKIADYNDTVVNEKFIDSNIKYHESRVVMNKTTEENKSINFEECENIIDSNIKDNESRGLINETSLENKSNNFEECENIIDSNIKDHESRGLINETSLENKSINFEECENIIDSNIKDNESRGLINETSLENKSNNFEECENIINSNIKDHESCEVINETSLENKSTNFKDCENIIDSNIKDHESCVVINETSQENKSINFEECENNKICVNQVENVGSNIQEEYSFANCDNYFEMPNRESSPIPESGFNLPDNGFDLPATEIQPNQIKMFEVDTNQSTPFLFGESFFGQQDIPENKPMFLFGQVYSFEKENFAIDANNDKHETQDSILDNNKDVVSKNECEEVVDVDDEIEDILELESLPESNPDDNLYIQKSSSKNILQLEIKESDKTFDQSILLNNSQKSMNINSDNINVGQIFENQNSGTSVEILSTKISTNLNRNSKNQLHDSLQLEKQTPDTDNNLQNIKELDQNNMNTEETVKLSCDDNDDKKNQEMLTTENLKISSKSHKITRAMSEPVVLKKITTKSKRSQSIPPNSRTECAQVIENNELSENQINNKSSLSHHTFSEVSNKYLRSMSSTHYLQKVITNENINTDLNKEESTESLQKENSCVIDSTIPENKITSHSENVQDDLKIKEINKDDSVTPTIHKSIPEFKQSIITISDQSLGKTTTELKYPFVSLGPKLLKSDQSQNVFTTQDRRMRKEKSMPPQNIDVIKTRSRTKSESNIVTPETSSSNIFRSSEIIDDTNRQVRVSLSKKRSKSQENVATAKRRSGRSKSLTPVEKTINTRKTVFGLELIPEEETSNSEKNVLLKNTVVTKKSKFNFNSKLIEQKNASSSVQDKKIKTPRRSKSLQPDVAALTLSLVKTKPKRSSSVNLLISDDKNSTNTDDFMGVLKKALVSPVKVKKRLLTESVGSNKKQKYTKQIESDLNESDENLNDSNSSNEEFSPIAGNNSQHMLFTPAKRKTKIKIAALDSSCEDSSNESTDSRPITRRSANRKNSSYMELEPVSVDKQKSTTEIEKSSKKIAGKTDKNISLLPKRGIKTIKETVIEVSKNDQLSTPERRITRSQKSILDSSLQSTSTLRQDEAIQNVPTPLSEKKIKKRTIKPKKK